MKAKIQGREQKAASELEEGDWFLNEDGDLYLATDEERCVLVSECGATLYDIGDLTTVTPVQVTISY